MHFFSDTSLTELYLLLVAFGLCSLIGIERQIRQKSAGFKTHVLVGIGAAAFTLISSFGFNTVVGQDVNLDPSRISAQIVSGIGFLGAGVIFMRKDIVRGLTTAATIWVTAAVGMACGAGMLSLAIFLTCLHLVGLVVLPPLISRIPTADRNQVLRVDYVDGQGILRLILQNATTLGFTASILSSRRQSSAVPANVLMDIKFRGRPPLRDLVPTIAETQGVRAVWLRDEEDDNNDE
ncbi:MgtC/SapB family protein [Arthrobacter sp. H14]|uniref:MgtC/SapB family protein n=1 Tax=Arthrobacter sp. H14 TaxID=1312959 RepID=UPI000479ED03|nr:MgtC/SapB family protein [Arthrobacter sp. H14]